MNIIEEAKKEAPKTWKYFEDFVEGNYPEIIDKIEFDQLSFDFQLGVYIAFFNSVSTDVDIYSTEQDALKDAVMEAFRQYEEYLFLDS